MKRRSFFTLVEMMISLSLLTILLSSLFMWYRHLTLGKKERSALEWRLREERYCDVQLGKVIPKIKGMLFTTDADQNASLVFTFDHGANPDPMLSGLVLGRIFHDRATHTLCLGIWPKPETKERNLNQTHILLEDVEEVNFSFFSPPDPFELVVDPEGVGKPKPIVGWQNEWKQEFSDLPPFLAVEIKKTNGRQLELHYELLNSTKNRIVYKEGV